MCVRKERERQTKTDQESEENERGGLKRDKVMREERSAKERE